MTTSTLYRPVNQAELRLIEQSGWRRFPPRGSSQPYFYPVVSRAYAEQIARDWNARDRSWSFVTRFDVETAYLRRYQRRVVGARIQEEYWVPSEELDRFNARITGLIEVVATYDGTERPASLSASA